jgi:hypothetical protein
MNNQNQIITLLFIMGFCFGVLVMCGYVFCLTGFKQSQPINTDTHHDVTFRFINMSGSSVQLNTPFKHVNVIFFRVNSQNETKIIGSYETGELIRLIVWSNTYPNYICIPMEAVIVEVSINSVGIIEAKYIVT